MELQQVAALDIQREYDMLGLESLHVALVLVGFCTLGNIWQLTSYQQQECRQKHRAIRQVAFPNKEDDIDH